MDIIVSPDSLRRFCADLKTADFITVDTEFIRDKTYWPQLCLIQMAGPAGAAIIDPLASGMSLEPFYELMREHRVLKVFHAPRQDIEIFVHEAGTIPHPLFDTQVAAMVCGFGEQVGYETLIRQLTGGEIDKSSRFTDWSRRPLSEKQLHYALADVTHLRTAYEKLAARLAANKRQHWVAEEMAILESADTYMVQPENAWLRLKSRSSNPRYLGVLRELAAWREREAQIRDLPRSRVLKDEALFEIAAETPHTSDELARLRAVPEGVARGKLSQGILAAVHKGVELPKDQLPRAPERNARNGSVALIELLKVLLKARCEDEGVAQKLVASAEDIELFAAGRRKDLGFLSGWRRDIFGADAVELVRGHIALSAQGNKVKVLSVPSENLPHRDGL
jgi:ribonuclease D